jgi:hypothetical protein
MGKIKKLFEMEYELEKLLERERKDPGYIPRRRRIEELEIKIKNWGQEKNVAFMRAKNKIAYRGGAGRTGGK